MRSPDPGDTALSERTLAVGARQILCREGICELLRSIRRHRLFHHIHSHQFYSNLVTRGNSCCRLIRTSCDTAAIANNPTPTASNVASG